jgi:hypothetical protein
LCDDSCDAGTATVLFNYSYMDPFFYENLGLASSADLTRGMWYTLYDSQGLSPAHSDLVGIDTSTGSIKHNVTAQRWSPFAFDNWATVVPTNDGTTIIGIDERTRMSTAIFL